MNSSSLNSVAWTFVAVEGAAGSENRKKNPVGLRADWIARAADILPGGRAFSSGRRDGRVAGLVDAQFGTA